MWFFFDNIDVQAEQSREKFAISILTRYIDSRTKRIEPIQRGSSSSDAGRDVITSLVMNPSFHMHRLPFTLRWEVREACRGKAPFNA